MTIDGTINNYSIKVKIADGEENKNILRPAMQMFFANGGSDCYVISVAKENGSPTVAKLKEGIAVLEKEDEPTIIVCPELALIDATTTFISDVLAQCSTLQDRVAIFDVPLNGIEADPANNILPETQVERFRAEAPADIEQTKYGAAYYPFLKTALTYPYDETEVEVLDSRSGANIAAALEAVKKLLKEAEAAANAADPADKATADEKVADLTKEKENAKKALDEAKAIEAVKIKLETAKTDADNAAPADKAVADQKVVAAENDLKTAQQNANTRFKLNLLKEGNNELYNAIKAKLSAHYMVLPPSSAIAGVYARVDRDRGVWKAPANVSLSYVIEPVVKINDKEQAPLNVHVNGGKSINVIRSFTGRGTMVWGARTLAGNDNEWRYVPVRRFFNFVEESVKKATFRFVFEPNNKNTWVKVKAMIENFLIVQWRAGALVGAKPEHAFFVKVGLNDTMTAEDVLNGYMVIEIGMAVVRPAEFIILQFSHKMQES